MRSPDIEYRPAEEIRRFQEEKLRETLRYLGLHSPYYRQMAREEGFAWEDIRRMEDLGRIPLTEKSDLQRCNARFLCVPRERVADYITTSGTLGEPVTFALSEGDLNRLAYNERLSFGCAGVAPGDVVQLMTTLDRRFMAGLAYYLGLRSIGAGVIRVGNGIPALQWDTLRRIRPDTLVCVPSFILHIIRYAEENGIDYRSFGVRKAVCIGENLREQDFSLNLLGRRIREKWDLALYSTYASTEMATTFTECSEGCGGHHHPELILCELVDDRGRPVAEGEPGELVVTTLGVEAMPLLRFRTGDVVRIHSEPCACGRTTFRVSPVVGRRQQMLKLKGTTLYPPAIFDVLDHTDYVENYLVEAASDANGNDCVSVRVGLRPRASPWGDEAAAVKDLKDRFRARLRVTPEVCIGSVEEVAAMNYPPMSRKTVKFIDKRKQITL
ncbi:MAG: AMP-binding protein [Tannerellaceae bacterium]|jgi:phenylacetate-CoA ligase|nr:AMP-binding protein [Tannerellaceae bacterium]